MKQTKDILIAIVLVLFTSCGEYQQVVRSKDPNLKYEKAMEYFNNQEYMKAQTLLDDIAPYYKGTERFEDIVCYQARCHMGQKDYGSASDYYEAYIRNYPKGRYSIEARFQLGHCQYLNAPDARLDQTITKQAIEAYTQFVELYPQSPYTKQAYDEMNELYDKLAYKEYLNAKLYYNLGTYLGNNYLSCEIVARNAIRLYPSNKYLEELSWYVFQAKFKQMENSTAEKLIERARDAQDEYYNFVTDYPNSKHRNQAEKMIKEINKLLK